MSPTASPMFNQWACLQSSREVLQGLNDMALLLQRHPCWVPRSFYTGSDLDPEMASFLGETSQLPGTRLIALDFFQLERVDDFVLSGAETYSRHWICFSSFQCSFSTSIRTLLEGLTPHRDIPYNTASDQRTYFKAKGSQLWGHKIHWLYHILLGSEAAALTEK